MDAPEVRYTRSGDVNIAYAVVGDGPFDVVFVSGWVLSNLEVAWDGTAAAFYERMASFCRLILFDKRGTGLSDRITGIPDLQTRILRPPRALVPLPEDRSRYWPKRVAPGDRIGTPRWLGPSRSPAFLP